jgi:hypothetical protein
MNMQLVQHLRPQRHQRRKPGPTGLVACSLCLRVMRHSEWVAAERAIRETRSFELESPPSLRFTVCDACAESISARRAEARRLAA